MQDGLTNGVAATHHVDSGGPPSSIAVEVATVSVDDDMMDTTPDSSQGLVLPNGSADPREVAANTPISPAPNGEVEDGTVDNVAAPVAPADAVC
jgi:hypothetical protein